MNCAERKIERVFGRRLMLQLVWNNGRLRALDVRWIDQSADQAEPRTDWGEQLGECLLGYEDGRPVRWPDVPLAWEEVRGFRLDVLRSLQREVGYGALTTYGALAAMVGKPGAARAVGAAMGSNPWSLMVP